MERDQLRGIFLRQHDILIDDIRLFIRTRVDTTSEADTARQRERVTEFLAIVERRNDLFNGAEIHQLRRNCTDMVNSLDDYARLQRDPPVAQSSAVTLVPTGGRPRKIIDQEFLRNLSQFRGPSGIARVLGVSARTVRRQQLDIGIGTPQPAVFLYPQGGAPVRNAATLQSRAVIPTQPLGDDQLDNLVAELMNRFQNHGRSLMHGQLHGLGHNPTRAMVSASMARVTGIPGHFGRTPIRRKKYRVAGPGSLWHHDGQHGLIHWGLVLHAFVDGYSRRVMGLRMSNNNRAATVLALFQDIVRVFGLPSRVRGDHGVENLGVAELMERIRGLNRGSYIWGPSVHNTRIERMWVDMVIGFVDKWKTFFLDLEANHGLVRTDSSHIQLLHYLFLPLINADAALWADGWNYHRFTRLPTHQHMFRDHLPCPEELYLVGEYEHGVRTLHIDDEAIQNDEDIAAYGAGDDHDDEHEVGRVERLLHEFQPEDGDIAAEQRHPNGWARPRQMFEVRVHEPTGLLSQAFLEALAAELATKVDMTSQSMAVRRLWWDAALNFLSSHL